MENNSILKETLKSTFKINNIFKNIHLYPEIEKSQKLSVKSLSEYLINKKNQKFKNHELIKLLKEFKYIVYNNYEKTIYCETWLNIKNKIKIHDVLLEEFLELENLLKKLNFGKKIKKKTFLSIENSILIEFKVNNNVNKEMEIFLKFLENKNNFILKRKEVLSVKPNLFFFNEFLVEKNLSTCSSTLSYKKLDFPINPKKEKISSNYIIRFFIENKDFIKKPEILNDKKILNLPIINKLGDIRLENLDPIKDFGSKKYLRKGFHKFSLTQFRKNSFKKSGRRKLSYNL